MKFNPLGGVELLKKRILKEVKACMFFYQAMAPNFILSFGRSVGDEETIKYCILYIMGLLARVEYIATVSV